MDFKGLDLNHLVVLHALLEERSVTRAAEKVFLSQPATSYALARLREYFGDALLVREGRSLVMTPASEQMLEPLRELLRQVDRLSKIEASFDPGTCSRTLRIDTSDYLMTTLLAKIVAQCSFDAPNLRFQFGLFNETSRERLERGEIDLLIAAADLVSSKHPTVPLFQMRYACLLWSGNPIASSALSESDFLAAGHVVTNWNGGLRAATADIASGHGGDPRRCEVSVSHYTLIPRFLVGTHRIATVQAELASQLIARASLVMRPCPLRLPAIDEVLQYHRFQEKDPLIAWMITRMKEIAGTTLTPTI